MMDFIKERLKETTTWIGLITLVAYIVMWFTPDDIDILIQRFIQIIGGGSILSSAVFNIVTPAKKK